MIEYVRRQSQYLEKCKSSDIMNGNIEWLPITQNYSTASSDIFASDNSDRSNNSSDTSHVGFDKNLNA